MAQNTTTLKNHLMCHGPDSRLAYISFTPNGTNSVTADESHGFDSTVTYSSTGVWTCQLRGAWKNIEVLGLRAVPGDTNFHELVHSINSTTGVITITHRTVTYANIVSAGPAASNTCGKITLALLVRSVS